MSAAAASWALRQRTGNSTAKLVLLVIADVATTEGVATYSQRKLAAMAEITTRTLRTQLQHLESGGLLRREMSMRANGSRSIDTYHLPLATPPEGISPPPPEAKGGSPRKQTAPLNPEAYPEELQTPVSPNGTNGQTELLPTANGNGKAPTNGNGYTPGFLELWSIHRQGGKPAALKAYLNAVPAKIGHEDAREFLERYRDSLNEGFRGANLSTWLNQEYWEQDDGEARGNGRPEYGRLRG